MGEDRQPVIHLGFPKTATTTLQTYFFPAHTEIAYMGIGGAENEDARDFRPVGEAIADPARDAADVRRMLEDLVEYHRSPGLRPVASHEYLLYHEPVRKFGFLAWIGRLSDTLDNVDVAVTIREQLSFLESLYRYENPGRPFPSWIDWLDPYLDALEYDRLLDALCDAFGEDRVHVFTFEMFCEDPEAFLREFSDALGIDPQTPDPILSGADASPSPTSWQRAYGRLRRRFLPNVDLGSYVPTAVQETFHQVLSAGPAVEPDIPLDTARRLRQRFRTSNEQLISDHLPDLPEIYL